MESIYVPKGDVRIFPMSDPDHTLFERKNVIVNTVSYLFSALFMSNTSQVASAWGLAIGAGGTSVNGWSPDSQPDPTAAQTSMVSEIKRKPFAQVQYIDPTSGNPTSQMTTKVRFLTIFNAATDNITVPIREMGLIGGGTTSTSAGGPTNMLTAPYFDPNNPNPNSVILINYVTQASFLVPQEDVGVTWNLQF